MFDLVFPFLNILADRERKSLTPSSPSAAVDTNGSSEKAMRANKVPAAATEKVMGAVVSPNMTTALELRNPSAANAKTSPAKVSQSCSSLPGETWLQVCATGVLVCSPFQSSALGGFIGQGNVVVA